MAAWAGPAVGLAASLPVRTAVVFPGQGSQRPGMGAPWRDTPQWALVDELGEALGRDLSSLLLTADAETLRATSNAQIATCLTSLLAWSALTSDPSGSPLAPVIAAGHSLGELTALIAAGALGVRDGLALVAVRGDAMQAAADQQPGTMAAVLGLEPEVVAQVCAGRDDVWPANDNAPRHVVIAGTVPGVAEASELLRAAGARRVLPLPVGGAFHTPLMEPARPAFTAAADAAHWREPTLPVLSAVDVLPYGTHPDGTQSYGTPPQVTLTAGLTSPVRWRELCRALEQAGVERVVEVGPGGVLAGLVRRCLPEVQVATVATPDDVATLAGR